MLRMVHYLIGLWTMLVCSEIIVDEDFVNRVG